jgi:hypothetical protein
MNFKEMLINKIKANVMTLVIDNIDIDALAKEIHDAFGESIAEQIRTAAVNSIMTDMEVAQ